MKKKLFFCIAAGLLLLTACTGEQAPPEPAPPDVPGQNEPVQPPAPEAPEAFTADEAAAVFALTEADLTALAGQPANVSVDGALRVVNWDGDIPQASFLSGALTALSEVRSDKIAAPRGVQIGAALADVLALFPDEGDETLYDREEGGSYRMLYGEYVGMAQYGLLLYADDTLTELVVSDQDYTVAFDFTGDRLTSISYRLAA